MELMNFWVFGGDPSSDHFLDCVKVRHKIAYTVRIIQKTCDRYGFWPQQSLNAPSPSLAGLAKNLAHMKSPPRALPAAHACESLVGVAARAEASSSPLIPRPSVLPTSEYAGLESIQ